MTKCLLRPKIWQKDEQIFSTYFLNTPISFSIKCLSFIFKTTIYPTQTVHTTEIINTTIKRQIEGGSNVEINNGITRTHKVCNDNGKIKFLKYSIIFI